MELIKYTGPGIREVGTEPMDNGLHLSGIRELDSETLCGWCGTSAPHHIIDGDAPTCKYCISIAKELFLNRNYSKKQIKNW